MVSFSRPSPSPNPSPPRKKVLASVTAPLACDDPGHALLLRGIVSGLMPAGARPCTAETFLPCVPQTQPPPPLLLHDRSRAAGGAQPRRVALCALPEECSRHNSPPQPHAIADCVRSMSGSGSVAIVMGLGHPSFAFAAGW